MERDEPDLSRVQSAQTVHEPLHKDPSLFGTHQLNSIYNINMVQSNFDRLHSSSKYFK